MASEKIQLAPRKRKPKEKQLKTTDEYINNHHGEKAERWLETNLITLAKVKIDRKNKSPTYIKELAVSMEGKHQINAAIVREISGCRYELISGECRFDAARINKEPLLVRVVDYDDEKAIKTIIAENEKREGLHDYDKAQFYISIKGKLSIRLFAEKYALDKNYINRLFKLDKIPLRVQEALPMVRLRALQFEEIAKLIEANSKYIDAFIELSSVVSHDETVTWKSFLRQVERRVNPPNKKEKSEKPYFIKRKGLKLGNIKTAATKFTVKFDNDLTEDQQEELKGEFEKAMKRVIK